MFKKGSYVLIEKIVLNKEERARNIPADTKEKPLIMHTKGFLMFDANIGDEVEIKTMTGRKEKGILIEANTFYDHSFGKYVDEVMQIRLQILKENEHE